MSNSLRRNRLQAQVAANSEVRFLTPVVPRCSFLTSSSQPQITRATLVRRRRRCVCSRQPQRRSGHEINSQFHAFQNVRSGRRRCWARLSGSAHAQSRQRNIHSHPRNPLGRRASASRRLYVLAAISELAGADHGRQSRRRAVGNRVAAGNLYGNDSTDGSKLVLTHDASGESFVSALYLGDLGLSLHYATPKAQMPATETAKLGPIADSQPGK